MKLVESSQCWKGSFSYVDGYDEIETYREVAFTLELLLQGEILTGTQVDEESKDLFDTPATVNGFIKDNTISFVVRYPFTYYRDQNGTMTIDREEAHPDIHYLGKIDDSGKHVVGDWEMQFVVEDIPEGDVVEILSGEFQMSRIR